MTNNKSVGQQNHEKGKRAEDLFNKIASISYSPIFCFPNPIDPVSNKEICDLLVICGDTALIWQIKDIKKNESGTFKQGKVDKAIKQSRGARKTLNSYERLTLINMDGESVEVDFTKLVNWHQVAAFVGETPDLIAFYDDYKDIGVHLFTDGFVKRAIKYLDTLNDLSDYLSAKEKLFHGNKTGFITIVGSEENLLVYYLQNARSFDQLQEQLSGAGGAILDLDGMWSDFVKSKKYKNKLKADRRGAAGWDTLISAAAGMPRTPQNKDMLRRMVETMSSHNRIERRGLGDAYYEGWVSLQDKPEGHTLRRISQATASSEKVMYIFLWQGNDVDNMLRLDIIRLLAMVAKKEFPEYNTFIGIGAPQFLSPTTPYDFCMAELNDDVWNAELQAEAEAVQKELGFLTSLKTKKVTTHEFPDDEAPLI